MHAHLLPLLSLLCFSPSCAAEENDNFSISIEGSVSVVSDSNGPRPLRCDAATEPDCAKMDFVTGAGYTLKQDDAFAQCVVTSDGDLRVELSASGDTTSAASAQLRVHRNAAPNGTARCEGLKHDPTSATGFARSSCDVIVRYGSEVFAATRFEKCTVTVTSSNSVRGNISCPLLRTNQASLIVNELSFYCVPSPEDDETEASAEDAIETKGEAAP